jgi:hypothetical protein
MPGPKRKSPRWYKVLQWDGKQSSDGSLNKNGTVDTTKQAKPLALFFAGQFSTAVMSSAVSVRIQTNLNGFDLVGHQVIKIPIRLKNPSRIQALLLRIYDLEGRAVYHECLTAAQIAKLPEFDPAVMPLAIDNRSTALVTDKTTTYARRGRSDYRAEVWVTKKARNLSRVTRWDSPAAVYKHTVSNQFVPTADQIRAKLRNAATWKLFVKHSKAWGDAVQQRVDDAGLATHGTQAKYQPKTFQVDDGGQPIVIAMETRATGEGNACVNNYTTRITDIDDQIQRVEDTLGVNGQGLAAKGFDANAFRLFVGPEWYFRKNNSDNPYVPYTHQELHDIVGDLVTMSLNHPNWLIIPGTIYFGLGYTQHLHQMSRADLNQVRADIDANFKLQRHGDIAVCPVRAQPVGSTTFVTGNVAPVIHNGHLIHYVFKVDAGEHPKAGVETYAPYLMTPGKRCAMMRSSLFAYGGRTFALDICKDHYSARAAVQFADKLGDFMEKQAETDLTEFQALETALDTPLTVRYHGLLAKLRKSGVERQAALTDIHNGKAGIENGWKTDVVGFDPVYSPEGVDVHILTCAGVKTSVGAIVAKHGGLFVRCDGAGSQLGVQRVQREAGKQHPIPGTDALITDYVRDGGLDVKSRYGALLSSIVNSYESSGDTSHAGYPGQIDAAWMRAASRDYKERQGRIAQTRILELKNLIENQVYANSGANTHGAKLYLDSV